MEQVANGSVPAEEDNYDEVPIMEGGELFLTHVDRVVSRGDWNRED